MSKSGLNANNYTSQARPINLTEDGKNNKSQNSLEGLQRYSLIFLKTETQPFYKVRSNERPTGACTLQYLMGGMDKDGFDEDVSEFDTYGNIVPKKASKFETALRRDMFVTGFTTGRFECKFASQTALQTADAFTSLGDMRIKVGTDGSLRKQLALAGGGGDTNLINTANSLKLGIIVPDNVSTTSALRVFLSQEAQKDKNVMAAFRYRMGQLIDGLDDNGAEITNSKTLRSLFHTWVLDGANLWAAKGTSLETEDLDEQIGTTIFTDAIEGHAFVADFTHDKDRCRVLDTLYVAVLARISESGGNITLKHPVVRKLTSRQLIKAAHQSKVGAPDNLDKVGDILRKELFPSSKNEMLSKKEAKEAALQAELAALTAAGTTSVDDFNALTAKVASAGLAMTEHENTTPDNYVIVGGWKVGRVVDLMGMPTMSNRGRAGVVDRKDHIYQVMCNVEQFGPTELYKWLL